MLIWNFAGRAMLKKSLGTDCFDDDSEYVGNFWGILETRPYMRVLQALAERLYMSKHFNESAYAPHFIPQTLNMR